MDEIAIGIDFGTTFSSVYLYSTRGPCPTLDDERIFIPTVIGYVCDEEAEEKWLYGKKALEEADILIKDIKRILGVKFSLLESQLRESKKIWEENGVKLRGDIDGYIEIGIPKDSTATQWFKPYELVGDYLSWLYKYCLTEEQRKMKCQVVITIPAWTNQKARQETQKAVQRAGIPNYSFINEPSAAAFAYIQHLYQAKKPYEFRNLLVVDFGGGTLDVSLVQTTSDLFNVKKSDGDQLLGGRDIDNKLYELLIQKLIDQSILSCPESEEEKKRLISPDDQREIMEEIIESKEGIDSHSTSLCLLKKSKIYRIFRKRSENIEILLSEFQGLLGEGPNSLLERLIIPIRRIIDDSSITIDQIDRVLLVGGTSKLQLIEDKIKTLIPPSKFETEFTNKRGAIVIGACYYAATKTRQYESAPVVNMEIQQRLAHDLGISLFNPVQPSEPLFSPILKRFETVFGGIIPPKNYKISIDNPNEAKLMIYECDGKFVSEGAKIGEVEIKGLPPESKGEVEISIGFQLDKNGYLNVTIKSLDHSGKEIGSKRIDYLKKIITRIEADGGDGPSSFNTKKAFELFKGSFINFVCQPSDLKFDIHLPDLMKKPDFAVNPEFRSWHQDATELCNEMKKREDLQVDEECLFEIIARGREVLNSYIRSHGIRWPGIFQNNEVLKRLSKTYKQDCVEVVFCIDATGSMSSWIEAAKQRAKAIAEFSREKYPFLNFKFGAIFYRDPIDCPSCDKHEHFQPTESIDDLISFMSKIRADGGGDGPEDWVGAFDILLHTINWNPAAAKGIVHIADAPAHGVKWGGVDSHQDEGKKLKPLIKECSEKRIFYAAIDVDGDYATPSFNRVREIYRKLGNENIYSCVEFDLNVLVDVGTFLENVSNSLVVRVSEDTVI